MRITEDIMIKEFEEMDKIHGERELIGTHQTDEVESITYQYEDGVLVHMTETKISKEIPVDCHGLWIGTVRVNLIRVEYLRTDKDRRRHYYIKDRDPSFEIDE